MENKIPPRSLVLVTIITFIGLILGIAGVSSAPKDRAYQPGGLSKGAMGIFLAVFVGIILLSAWLFFGLSFSLRRFQKKLFLAIVLSFPFLLVRMIYSSLSNYSSNDIFALDGDATAYLCMSVLEEIIAMAITMAFGISAVLEEDFVKPVPQEDLEAKPYEPHGP